MVYANSEMRLALDLTCSSVADCTDRHKHQQTEAVGPVLKFYSHKNAAVWINTTNYLAKSL